MLKQFLYRQQMQMIGYDQLVGLGVAMGNGDTWHTNRRWAIRFLHEIGIGKTQISRKIEEEAGHFLKAIETRNENGVIDLHDVTTQAFTNVLSLHVFGKRFETDDKLYKEFINLVETFKIKNPFVNAPILIFPFLRHVLPHPSGHSFAKGYSRIQNTMQTALENSKAQFDGETVNNIFDYYLFRKCDIPFSHLTIMAVEMYAAGMSSSRTTFSWVIFNLLHNSNWLKRCQEEIDQVICNDRLPTIADREHLPIVMACIHETLRLHPTNPLLTPRSGHDETLTLGEYEIPPWTMIMVNAEVIHRNPDIWQQPDVYNPGRFIGDDGKLLANYHTANNFYMPFGYGPRFCIGQRLALDMIFIFITSLIQRYDLKLVSSFVDPEASVWMFENEPSKYMVKIVPRV